MRKLITMTASKGACLSQRVAESVIQRCVKFDGVPPLRFAPVGMT